MKISEIDIKLEQFAPIRKEMKKYFGPHFKNVVYDFNVTNQAFLRANGDPDIIEEKKDEIYQAVSNYFIFYCFGVANTIDPKSKFNTEYENEKINDTFKEIEKDIKEGKYDKE